MFHGNYFMKEKALVEFLITYIKPDASVWVAHDTGMTFRDIK